MNTQDRATTALKYLLQKAMTERNKGVNNEAEGRDMYTDSRYVWNEGKSLSNDGSASSAAFKIENAKLVLDITSNNQAYFTHWPDSLPSGAPSWAVGGARIEGGLVPESYNLDFEAKPKASGGTAITKGDAMDWLYDYSSGIFLVNNTGTGTVPTTIDVYLYTGTTAADRPPYIKVERVSDRDDIPLDRRSRLLLVEVETPEWRNGWDNDATNPISNRPSVFQYIGSDLTNSSWRNKYNWAALGEGLTPVSTAQNNGANFRIGYKLSRYHAVAVGADSIDFGHDWNLPAVGSSSATGARGLSCFNFGYANTLDGTLNTALGYNILAKSGSGYGLYVGYGHQHDNGSYSSIFGILNVSKEEENFIHGDSNVASAQSFIAGKDCLTYASPTNQTYKDLSGTRVRMIGSLKRTNQTMIGLGLRATQNNQVIIGTNNEIVGNSQKMLVLAGGLDGNNRRDLLWADLQAVLRLYFEPENDHKGDTAQNRIVPRKYVGILRNETDFSNVVAGGQLWSDLTTDINTLRYKTERDEDGQIAVYNQTGTETENISGDGVLKIKGQTEIDAVTTGRVDSIKFDGFKSSGLTIHLRIKIANLGHEISFAQDHASGVDYVLGDLVRSPYQLSTGVSVIYICKTDHTSTASINYSNWDLYAVLTNSATGFPSNMIKPSFVNGVANYDIRWFKRGNDAGFWKITEHTNDIF